MSHKSATPALSLTSDFPSEINMLIESEEIQLNDALTSQRIMNVASETDPWVWAVVALAFARLRQGSVCVDLIGASERLRESLREKLHLKNVSDAALEVAANPWDDPDAWARRIEASSACIAGGPLLIDGMLLYLEQYHRAEGEVVSRIVAALAEPPASAETAVQPAQIDDLLAELFPASGESTNDFADQKHAARVALTHRLNIITGGPGSGKTTTISRVLAGVLNLNPAARIALAAPTGKAAARMAQSIKESSNSAHFPFPHLRESLQKIPTSTIHRLLGMGYSRSTPKHNEHNTLPYDVVIIDEVSMVPLILMQHILAGTRPQAQIVLVGDAHQLQSVDAGNVLADLVNGLSGQTALATLQRSRRFSGAIGELAGHILNGRADGALSVIENAPVSELQLTPYSTARENQLPHLLASFDLANEANSAQKPEKLIESLEQHRMLCAHREGPAGEKTWNNRAHEWLSNQRNLRYTHGFYVGQPVMVTSNDYQLGLANGDSGIICLRDGEPVVLLDAGTEPRFLPVSRIHSLIAAHALTIHRAQGSQSRHISVVLPPVTSPLLTRELLYTAATRAQESLTLIGEAESIRAAIARRAQRTTGLADRLRSALSDVARG